MLAVLFPSIAQAAVGNSGRACTVSVGASVAGRGCGMGVADGTDLASSIPNWGERFRVEVAEPLVEAVPFQVASAEPADSLPEGMPLIKRVFWGERGIVRAVGLAPEHRAQELRLRRRMLQWHQRMGLVTLAAFTAQMVTGVTLYNDVTSEIPDAGEGLRDTHRLLGYTTFGLYSATAALSLTAPPARRYGASGLSSIKLHRYLAIIHFTGMMAQPWLGRWATEAGSPDEYRSRIRTHRIVGWTTYGAFTAAIVSFVLPL